MKKILTLAFLASLSALPISASADTPKTSRPTVIVATPPAPTATDSERWAELARRRSAVAAKMADRSMLVLFSAEPKLYAYDVDYVYRQENNLYYLTNLKQANAAFVMVKSGQDVKEFLFIPKRDARHEAWEGRMYSSEDVTKLSGLKTIIDAAEFEDFLEAAKGKRPFSSKNQISIPAGVETVYTLLQSEEDDNEGKREYRQEMDWVRSFAKVETDEKTGNYKFESATGYKVGNALPIFAELRHTKSPYELKRIQHAIDITTEAHMRSQAMAGRAKWEYEVHAEVEYVFRRRNADSWGYPSIVGCGANATTLHYVESQSPVVQGELMLMDVGAEYDHLTADVTRTFPVNGKFSPAQADIYRIVYNAQEAAAAVTKPGGTFGQASQAARKVIDESLAKLGLITGPGATIPGAFNEVPDGNGGTRQVPRSQTSLFAIHGLGHWLGMNVHDLGEYGAPFRPGMIYTNEPGIYIREDALDYLPDTPEVKAMIAKIRPAYEKYKNIGVRIEDDMLVTDSGHEWMTKKLPRKLEDIEAFMAAALAEVPFQASVFSGEPANIFVALSGGGMRRGVSRSEEHNHDHRFGD
jgi:Xaa-Pro aminopeptidase